MVEKYKITELKPCPFCAKFPHMIKWHENLFSVSCNCGCESPNNSVSENGAKRIWNRRRYINA